VSYIKYSSVSKYDASRVKKTTLLHTCPLKEEKIKCLITKF
jgi:hypothetical protein